MLLVIVGLPYDGTPTIIGQLTFVSLSWSMCTTFGAYLGHVHFISIWSPSFSHFVY